MTRPHALLLFSVCFVAGFLWLRTTSTFARVQARADEAQAVAASTGLAPAEVMALLDLGAGLLSPDELAERARQVADARTEFGDLGLAVAATWGHAPLVRELAAGVQPAAAAQRLRARQEGIVMSRFLAMAERYRAAVP